MYDFVCFVLLFVSFNVLATHSVVDGMAFHRMVYVRKTFGESIYRSDGH